MGIILILLLLASSTLNASSYTIVETLPGYPGTLPFKLETGYIGVGEDEAMQLFYYFVESERNPKEDPLIVWLAGGPGCSGLYTLFNEIGPLQIRYGSYMDNVPALELRPNSWTQVANVIYLDAPILTGYSYTKTSEAVIASDTTSASHTTEFIRKFVKNHPKFIKNPLYVCGISYSGIVMPMITEELYKGNDEGLEPILNIQGYIGGNPLTDKNGDINSRLEFVYRVALISEELYETTKKDCNGDYSEVESNSVQCMLDIDEVNKRVRHINILQILEHECDHVTSLVRGGNPIRRETNLIKMLPAQSSLKDPFCQDDYHKYLMSLWARDVNVMRALNVRKGTLKEWLQCNPDMTYHYDLASAPSYKFNVRSSVVYHQKLSNRNCRALIYSGDQDMMVPHVGTHRWINSLNLTITDSNWDAWYVNGQNAGYKTTYARDNYTLVFATIKGAGHIATGLKPKECFEMIKRWFHDTRI